MLRLIDTHAHLSDLRDKKGVIDRAKAIGLEAIIAVGVNMETCKSTLEWASEYRGYVHPALGIHPTEWMNDTIQDTLDFIEKHIDECIAVGEIGLDYWSKNARKNRDVRARQRELYVQQLDMAKNYEKPASVHSRGSWKEALRLAKEHEHHRIVFHWFSGPLEILREILDCGYLISATPAAEFSKHHRAALAETPIDNILIETDSPVSYHGKLAEPSDIIITLKSLAEIKDLPEETIAEITTENAKKFLDL